MKEFVENSALTGHVEVYVRFAATSIDAPELKNSLVNNLIHFYPAVDTCLYVSVVLSVDISQTALIVSAFLATLRF